MGQFETVKHNCRSEDDVCRFKFLDRMSHHIKALVPVKTAIESVANTPLFFNTNEKYTANVKHGVVRKIEVIFVIMYSS